MGQGLCIGNNIPSAYSNIYNCTVVPAIVGYMLPPEDVWWAWALGLALCIYGLVINMTGDFCVLVQLVPRVDYYSGEGDVFN